MEKEHLAYMIIKLLADDQNAIPYRPPIARVYREHGFRSPINTTILLQLPERKSGSKNDKARPWSRPYPWLPIAAAASSLSQSSTGATPHI